MIGTDGKADGKSFEGKHLSTEISNHYKDVATETIPKRSILEVGDAPTGPSLKLPEDSDAPTSTRGRRNDHSAGTRQNSPSLLPQDSPQRKSTSRTSSVSPPGDNSLQTTASSPSPCVDNHFSPSSTGSRVSGPVPADTGVSYSMTSETSESILPNLLSNL